MGVLSVLSLFSGAGGLELGARLVGGFRTVGYVEYDRYAQGVLMSRIRSGDLDDAPIWSDVTTFDGKPWRGLVDVIAGGFPCQDVSQAGKRAGVKEGTRSGLWSEFARIIREVEPRFVLVENVRGLLSVDAGGGFGTVLGDLANLGFDARWYVLSAAAVGAPHRRERVWIIGARWVGLADPQLRGRLYGEPEIKPAEAGLDAQRHAGSGGPEMADADSSGREGERCARPAGSTESLRGGEDVADSEGEQGWRVQQPGVQPDPGAGGQDAGGAEVAHAADGRDVRWDWELRADEEAGRVRYDNGAGASPDDGWQWWAAEPPVGRVVNGVAHRVDRLRLCGNGVVPQQAAPAWSLIKEMEAA